MTLARLFTIALALCAVPLLAFALAHPATQAFIESSGVHIPTDNVITDFTWGIVWACLLLLSIFAWPVSWEHKKMLAAGWLVKCFTALVLMLPYEEHYYGLDCWFYFSRAHADTADILVSMVRGGADVIIALGALQITIGPDSYHALKLTFAMIGLVALYLFYRTAELLAGRHLPAAFWVLLLYPSILFWSSIFGKDPLVLLSIAVHVWGLINMAVSGKPRYLLAIVGGILVASAVRIWMGPILLVPCLFVVVLRIKNVAPRFAAAVAVIVMLFALGSATIDRLSLRNATDLVEAARSVTDGWNVANSSLQREVELNSAWDLLLFAPQGLFDTFFRPLPGDVANVFGWLAGFENVVLLAFSFWGASRFRVSVLRNPLFFWAATLLLTWGSAYSIIAYKDLGTAVRFKLQILPVLLGVVGCLIQLPRASLIRSTHPGRAAPFTTARDSA